MVAGVRALVTWMVLVAAGCAPVAPEPRCAQTTAPFPMQRVSCSSGLGVYGMADTPDGELDFWVPVCSASWSLRCSTVVYDSDVNGLVPILEGERAPVCMLAVPTCPEGSAQCVFVPCDGEWHHGS